MSSGTIIGLMLIGFVIFITARGSLSTYLSFFV